MSKLNGSVERLAEALRDVIKDGVAEAVEPLREEMRGMNTRLDGVESRLDGVESGLRTTNENIQAQLAHHREDVAGDVRRILREERA